MGKLLNIINIKISIRVRKKKKIIGGYIFMLLKLKIVGFALLNSKKINMVK
jgi:hypothetical protein